MRTFSEAEADYIQYNTEYLFALMWTAHKGEEIQQR